MSDGLPGTFDDPDVERIPPPQPPTTASEDLDEAPAAPAADVLGGPEEQPDPVPVVKGLDRRRGLSRLFGNARLAWGVALLALVIAAFAGTQWADLYARDQAREEVRGAATELALGLTTFEGENIEDWVAQARAQATGDYAEQLTTLFDQALRDALREQEVVSRGEVDQLFVQDINGDEASVFALVTQTIVNASTTDPVQDELRMDITMRRVEGEWKASDVAVLGPSGLVGTPQTPGTPGEEPDQ